jgi:hypothetical protein
MLDWEGSMVAVFQSFMPTLMLGQVRSHFSNFPYTVAREGGRVEQTQTLKSPS